MKTYRVLDLFSGPDDPEIPGGWHNVWREHGHDVTTLDLGVDGTFAPTFNCDILSVTTLHELERGMGRFDVIAASPPCTAFSVAAMGKNWERYMGRNPVNGKTEWLIKGPKGEGAGRERAELGMRIARHTFSLIDDYAGNNAVYYVIENPVGAMRVMPFARQRMDRHTTWYCQWGERRAKPTDLWTNIAGDWPICRPGAGDHDAAPRGAKTGTQGLRDAKTRSRVPARLADAVFRGVVTGGTLPPMGKLPPQLSLLRE